MREKIIYFSEKICYTSAPVDVYSELAEYFEKVDFIVGKANILECIWRLTEDSNLLLEIGDIFFKTNNDTKIAYKFYREYFSSQNNEIFAKFLELHNRINNISITNDNDFLLYKKSELSFLYGKFVALIVILYFLHYKKEYQLLLEVEVYLDKIKNDIENFVCDTKNIDYIEIKQIQEDVKTLSETLSQTAHHNDINYLAIKFNPNNEQAYINILDDLLTYKNYEEALSFYNSKYAQIFNKQQVTSIIPICWQMVDIFDKNLNFYKSLSYQKLALEIELGE